jgi:class 3 adenylate cyclase
MPIINPRAHSAGSPNKRRPPHRTEVVVLFCDLRGFTGFAGATEPDAVMGLLQEYYEALGIIITRYEATLTCFTAGVGARPGDAKWR